MVTMTRPAKMMKQMMSPSRQSSMKRHPVMSIVGLVLFAFVAFNIVGMIPDFIRYMKLREM
jgi:formate-dependent nitrite reductase membrane component NrfD